MISHIWNIPVLRSSHILLGFSGDTTYSFVLILWLVTAALLVCVLVVLPHQSHTSYNVIDFQQFKFISFLPLRFPISSHSSEFNYHFLGEALPDVPNEVRCLLRWIRWDGDIPSTALPQHTAPWTKVYFQHNTGSSVGVRTTSVTTHHPVIAPWLYTADISLTVLKWLNSYF